MSLQSPIFSVKEVSYRFPGESEMLFSRLSVDIYEGEAFAILGPSGVGKTVFLKMLAGLIHPISGQVLFRGEPVRGPLSGRGLPFLSKISMTFQRGGLFDSLTVGDNLRFPLRESRLVSGDKIDSVVTRALDDVGLSEFDGFSINEISGGMQKRLGIARALVLSPEVVLYDDPTAGLDPVTSKSIDQLIVEMKRKYGMTIVVVTSDPGQASLMANRIGFLYQGSFIKVGSVADIMESSDPLLSQFIHGLLQGPLTEGNE